MITDVTIEEWQEALRSGRYRQGSVFYHKADCFCALGVFIDLLCKKNGWEWEQITDESFLIPLPFRWDCTPTTECLFCITSSIIELNDNQNRSFAYIADVLPDVMKGKHNAFINWEEQ